MKRWVCVWCCVLLPILHMPSYTRYRCIHLLKPLLAFINNLTSGSVGGCFDHESHSLSIYAPLSVQTWLFGRDDAHLVVHADSYWGEFAWCTIPNNHFLSVFDYTCTFATLLLYLITACEIKGKYLSFWCLVRQAECVTLFVEIYHKRYVDDWHFTHWNWLLI